MSTLFEEGENSALGTILIKGNPGYLPHTCEALKDLTDQAPDRTDCMPIQLYEALRSLACEQAEELCLLTMLLVVSPQTPAVKVMFLLLQLLHKRMALSHLFDADSTMLGRNAGTPRNTDVGERPRTASGGKRGAIVSEGRSDSNRDDMEFAIPTTVDTEGGSEFQGSPKMSDCGPVDTPEDSGTGPESLSDRRPPSRSGLRPRPRSTGSMIQSPNVGGADSAGFDPPAAGCGPTSSRRKINRRKQPSSEQPADVDSVDLLGGTGMAVGTARNTARNSVVGPSRSDALCRRAPTRSQSAGSRTTSSFLRTSKETIPFYPSGTTNGTNYDAIRKSGYTATPRARAAQYSEGLRFQLQLMRGEELIDESKKIRKEKTVKRAKKVRRASQSDKSVGASALIGKDTSARAKTIATRRLKKRDSEGEKVVRALDRGYEKCHQAARSNCGSHGGHLGQPFGKCSKCIFECE